MGGSHVLSIYMYIVHIFEKESYIDVDFSAER